MSENMRIVTPPRFQGNAIEKKGGWELFITTLRDNTDPLIYESVPIFKTKELALESLKSAVKTCCDIFHKLDAITGATV